MKSHPLDMSEFTNTIATTACFAPADQELIQSFRLPAVQFL